MLDEDKRWEECAISALKIIRQRMQNINSSISSAFCSKCNEYIIPTIIQKEEEFPVKGEVIAVASDVCYCPKCGNYAFSLQHEDKNLIKAYTIYGQRHELPDRWWDNNAKVTGWTYYKNPLYKEIKCLYNIETLRNLIVKEIRRKRYKFNGYYHHDGEYGIPIIDNKYIVRFSCPDWGEIIADAYNISDENGTYYRWAWEAPEDEESVYPNPDDY